MFIAYNTLNATNATNAINITNATNTTATNRIEYEYGEEEQKLQIIC